MAFDTLQIKSCESAFRECYVVCHQVQRSGIDAFDVELSIEKPKDGL